MTKNQLENTENLEKKTELKFPETLEEQRDYYLNLYQKWAKWQKETPEKLPIGFRKKEEFDFGKEIKNLKKNNGLAKPAIFFKLSENDNEIKEILTFISFFIIFIRTFFIEMESTKKILFFNNRWLDSISLVFEKSSGKLHIINKQLKEINLKLENCTFSHITLENFDRGYFSPETNDYLNQMESEGKLTLINCTWSGLPVVRENFEVNKAKNQKTFEFNKIISGQHRSAFAQYFAGFKDFILYSQGKNIGLEISLNGEIEFKVFSDNSEDLADIENSLAEFTSNILRVATGQQPFIRISNVSERDYKKALILVQSKVNGLELALQLKDDSLILEREKIKFLTSNIEKLKTEILHLTDDNKKLEDQSFEFLQKIELLQNQIRSYKIEDINNNYDKIDILIGLMSEFKLAISDKNDISLAKKSVNRISDFLKLNEKWIKLIPVILKTVQTLKVLIEEFGREF